MAQTLAERTELRNAFRRMTKTELADAIFNFTERLEACEVAIDKMDNAVPPVPQLGLMEDNRNRCWTFFTDNYGNSRFCQLGKNHDGEHQFLP